MIKLQLHVTFNFSKASEEIEPSEDLSQSSSDQRTADEKANGNWFLKKSNPFSKVSGEIKPLEENLSQSGFGQRTGDEKSNGQVSIFFTFSWN